ncbi:MAG: dihydroneopterin aldolase [Anaerolineae bacterium]|nr:dihydroneopterin aldolase [Anaerolineae bacterium]NUQ06392.1 dihydroneopterin aldolase [Anaerolineae bacterium]
MDQIRITGLRLRCIIGFNPDERREKQDVVIDMTFFTDLRKGGVTDDPNDILNYKTVNKAVIKHVEASSFNTLEALATSIARVACVDCAVPHILVTVHKPGALRFTDDVSVTLERTPADFA